MPSPEFGLQGTTVLLLYLLGPFAVMLVKKIGIVDGII